MIPVTSLGQFDKVEVKHTLKLDREDLFIPPRQFGQPVVGGRVGAFLSV